MKDDAKTQLKKILGAYDEKLAEVERRDALLRAAHAAFPGRFAALKTEMIGPALRELAAILNERGHEAVVREQEESSSTAGGVSSAAISLRTIPKPFAHKGADTNKRTIEVTFSANRSERRVAVSSINTVASSGGSIGKRGEYELDAMTADVVVDHVLKTLQEAFEDTSTK